MQYSSLSNREILTLLHTTSQYSPMIQELSQRLEKILHNFEQITREANNINRVLSDLNTTLPKDGIVIPEDIALSSKVQEAVKMIGEFTDHTEQLFNSIGTIEHLSRV